MRRVVAVLALAALVPACGDGGSGGGASPAGPDESRSGGDTTVFDVSENAFGFPAANLSAPRSDAFFVGNSFFKTNWTIAPASADGRDGLGPVFNALSCSSCHLKDGRSAPPQLPGEEFLGLLLRISVPGPGGEPLPLDDYGDQIQNQAIPGVPAEGIPAVSYVEVPGTYGDGSPYSLRVPAYSIGAPAFGALPPDLQISPRIGNAIFGGGLLELIPAAEILSREDPADADGDGISGRANVVLDIGSGLPKLGRFGWKANQPSLEQQAAGAFLGDIGITTPLFPLENCRSVQGACASAPNGGAPEVDQDKLDFVTFYLKTLAVPGRRNVMGAGVRRGKELFGSLGCAACHVPLHVTGTDAAFPELSGQTIFPYTDLLLHDLGPDLADGRPDGLATGTEWRTPPLWGLGLQQNVSGHTFLLHDGRARNAAEAILWHGGEAQAARELFRTLSAADRAALLEFLDDL